MKNKEKEEMKWCSNSTLYNKLRWKRIYQDECLCPYCSPHAGCNARGDFFKRSWKEYRKTQYKVVRK